MDVDDRKDFRNIDEFIKLDYGDIDGSLLESMLKIDNCNLKIMYKFSHGFKYHRFLPCVPKITFKINRLN